MTHVYVLVSLTKNLRFYVGMTDNLEKRIQMHNSGYVKSTMSYAPWILFFSEIHPNKAVAREREKFLKGGSGKAKIKLMWESKLRTINDL